ncbi:transcriptional regulator [Clostridium diolis]|uniref:helix-turn-helix transcriptional regulator n=1 Tax=Clostridium diolis TaxID=223919 RepID=UPI000B402FA3|nr:YafY family protein [Clostridium diolis]OVE65959.1 transcriptional regulator [Clostridium diolis]
MQINRLFQIIYILLGKKSVTAKELAENFKVSTRTIYRDIDILSSVGIPVYMSKGNGGGIHLMENYTLSKALISDLESKNLMLSLKAMQATQYHELDSILEKMGAIFNNSSDYNFIEVDFSHWKSCPDEKNKFNNIKLAILQQNVIEFDYVNAQGNKSKRLAEPNKLIFKNDTWYLLAFCRKRQEQRIFRISRLKNLNVLNETFDKKLLSESSLKKWDTASQSFINLKLYVKPHVLNRIYDYFDDSFILPNDDGSFTLDVILPDNDWLISYILSFGNSVKVLEPEHIRKAITYELKNMLNFYNF